MDLKSLALALSQVAAERGISNKKIIEIVEQAISSAYKKDYGNKGQIIKAKFNPKTGDVKFWQIKLVVDEKMIYSEEELEELKEQKDQEKPFFTKNKDKDNEEDRKIRFNPERHIMLADAKKENKEIKVDEELEIELEPHDNYGRVAAQTAKQVILQRMREAEREVIFEEYKSKEGEITSGIIQRIEGSNIYFDIGRTLGILPREEQVFGETYRIGQRLKLYILKVEESSRGPLIFLSRNYPKLISKLFEIEVPEISAGSVVVRSIAREAGLRTKIAVESKEEGIDPIGSVVGQKGTRVLAVTNELGGEKIDIIEYSKDSKKYITNSLSPAKVLEVEILPKNKAVVIVPEDQLSLAIGKSGQNVRLAAKLTGWKIDVKSDEKKEEKTAEKKEDEKKAVEDKKAKKEKTDEKSGKEAKEVKETEKETVKKTKKSEKDKIEQTEDKTEKNDNKTDKKSKTKKVKK